MNRISVTSMVLFLVILAAIIFVDECYGETHQDFLFSSNTFTDQESINRKEFLPSTQEPTAKSTSRTTNEHSTSDKEDSIPQLLDAVSIEVESVGQSRVKLKVHYLLKEYNDIAIYGFYVDEFHHRTIFYKYQHGKYANPGISWKDSIEMFIDLPNELFYYNHQNSSHRTNYYASQLGFRATLDLVNPDDNEIVVSVQGDLKYISFPDPWDRTQLPTYCISWEMYIKDIIKNLIIPSCKLLSDTDVFSTVLPLAGSTGGFTRKLSDLTWPSHILSHIKDQYESNYRFSVTMWFFLTKRCPNSCMLLQMRNTTNYHTPLLLLNSEGHLHVQLHGSDGSGEAFISREKIPLFTWVFILLTVDTSTAEFYINHGNNGTFRRSVYNGHLRYVFGGKNSLVVVGGYHGTRGIHGYIGPLRVYRHFVLSNDSMLKSNYLHDTRTQLLRKLTLNVHHKRCAVIRKIAHHCLGVVDNHGRCVQKTWWKREELPAFVRNGGAIDLNKNEFRNRTAAIIQDAIEELKLDSLSTFEETAEKIHKMAVKRLTKKSSSTPVVLRLLEVSGCLGHSESFFVTATVHKYGVGTPVDADEAVRYHLIAAQMNNPLSQLSLAYRHQLCLDGRAKDTSIQAGYMRRVAETSKANLDAENYQVFTQSEMIRLDQADGFRDVRGKDSQFFKWLSQQAKMGSMEARNQVAELLFYGKQGVDPNPGQAIQHFQDAAEAGDPLAMYNLGVMHIKGVKGFEKNMTTALKYLRKSTELNNSLAFNVMGFIELNHNANRSGAVHYWKKSAEMGDLQAMYNYGTVLESGGADGNSTDTGEALKLYEKAASQGERHSCMKLADLLIEGAITKRDEETAIKYYEYLAHQLQEIGLLMRNAFDDYIDGKRYSSFLNYLFAVESGIQLAGYNVALLLEEAGNEIQDTVGIADASYYYNFTAELGWSLSLMKMGHSVWSNETNTELASKYYARSIEKNNNPEALFYLGYLVENGYALHKDLTINNVTSIERLKKNFTVAETLYQGCIDSTSENAEGYYPCHLALMKLRVKSFIVQHSDFTQPQLYVILLALCIMAIIGILVVIVTMTRTGSVANTEETEEVNNNDAGDAEEL